MSVPWLNNHTVNFAGVVISCYCSMLPSSPTLTHSNREYMDLLAFICIYPQEIYKKVVASIKSYCQYNLLFPYQKTSVFHKFHCCLAVPSGHLLSVWKFVCEFYNQAFIEFTLSLLSETAKCISSIFMGYILLLSIWLFVNTI